MEEDLKDIQIGNQDELGNILILGGWKANLYQTPKGTFRLVEVKAGDCHIAGSEEEALRLYNQFNNTYLTSIPIPQLKEEGVELPFTKGKILGKFESSSQPGTFHYIIQPPKGEIYCTCFGFRAPNKCWHYRLIMDVGPDKITGTITVALKKEGDKVCKERYQ